MGSSASTLSVAAAIVGAVGYGVYQYTHLDAVAPAPAIAQGSKKKGKSTEPTPAVVSLAPATAVPSIPGEFDSGSDAPAASGKTKKPKKKKSAAAKKASALSASAASEADATSEADSVAPPPTPQAKKKKSVAAAEAEAWTRVESKKAKKGSTVATPTGDKTPLVSAPLAVEVTEASVTTATGSSSPATERTTDEEPVREQSKVKPPPGEQPAKGFTWEDYEGVDADADSDWGVVSSKKPRRKTDDDGWTTVPSRSRPASAAGANKPGLSQSENDEPTKKQRQNAAKRDAQKATKEQAERERLARLAKHKRELERVRSEQFI